MKQRIEKQYNVIQSGALSSSSLNVEKTLDVIIDFLNDQGEKECEHGKSTYCATCSFEKDVLSMSTYSQPIDVEALLKEYYNEKLHFMTCEELHCAQKENAQARLEAIKETLRSNLKN